MWRPLHQNILWIDFVFYDTLNSYDQMEMEAQSERLVKPGIEPSTPGLQGKWLLNQYVMELHVSRNTEF